MKVSLNWAQKYSNVPLVKDKTKLLIKIGAQLGEIDEVIEWGPRYEGIVVANVIECIKHSNADKLSLCKVDDGGVTKNVARDSNGLVQVVCGAPNVRAGMLVAWIPPGVTVPSTVDKDPFVLSARDIRGQMSNGMLASLHELGISDDHEGILEIKPDEVGKELAKPGTPFKKLYSIDDTVVDIENKMFTHRPDCFGILGIARELAGIQQLSFKSPDWYSNQPTLENGSGLALDVRVEDKKLIPRFMAVAVKNVKIEPSPAYMQAGLNRVGMKPINNIVDITNFVMYLTGQPLHAYDYDKVKTKSSNVPVLIARSAKKKEKLTLLGGKVVEVEDPAIVIATDMQPIGVGGVMGGAETEVDESTRSIILECANFDMYSIRKTSMKYGLFTDAVTRFNKGQSPQQTDRVLAYALEQIAQLAGGEVASKIFDINSSKDASNSSVSVTAPFINERLGTSLSLKEIATLLENVEFKIKSVPADTKRLHVVAPFWRTDIEIPEDIVEEVGRLYGYDRLPVNLPVRNLTPAPPNKLLSLKSQLRQLLAAAGANEVLTYSFVHGNLMKKVGQDSKNAYEISNALSPDLQYMRMSIVPSLLDKVHPNLKAGYDEFILFEMGTVHNKDLIDKHKLPIEEHRLGFLYAANSKQAEASYSGAAFFQAKHYLETILSSLGIKAIYEPSSTHTPKAPVGKNAIAPFEPTRSCYVKTEDGELIAELGELKASVRRNLKLPNFIAAFELDIERLLKHASGMKYRALPRYPKIEQDVSLRLPATVTYSEVFSLAQSQIEELKPEHAHATLTPVDIFQPEDGDKKHITLRLSIASYERTLTADVVNKLLDDVAKIAKTKLAAERI